MAKNNYIDNKQFLDEMVKFRKSVNKAKRAKEPRPQIPRFIAECFLKIAENYSHNHKFIAYTFKDEMISDAVENCVRYIDNFDPKKSSNPFAYFSQVTFFAFLRRIKREKQELYVKYKSTQICGLTDEYEINETDDGTPPFRQFELYDNIAEFIENYEKSLKEKKVKKTKKIALEKFMD